MRFAFVQDDKANKVSTQLIDEFSVEKFPTLLMLAPMEREIEVENDLVSHQYQILVYDGKMKLPEIVEWVKPYALSETKKKAEQNIG